MFGPESGKYSWQDLPFLYEVVRGVSESTGAASTDSSIDRFLAIFSTEGCKMVQMSCELHDSYAVLSFQKCSTQYLSMSFLQAGSQFVTHLTGRILAQQGLRPTPIDTKGFQSLLGVVDTTCKVRSHQGNSSFKWQL
jgi:hypothetical protein